MYNRDNLNPFKNKSFCRNSYLRLQLQWNCHSI
nr:MAG TPA: hypothetical protein [Caudoviricetes sp.]